MSDLHADRLSIVELSSDERRALARSHPEIEPGAPAVVISGRRSLAVFAEATERPVGRDDAYPAVEEAASEVREPALADPAFGGTEPPIPGAALLGDLVDVLTPDLRVPSAAAVAQARRNALARAELAREFGLLTSIEVAGLAGSRARNRAALANRWKQERRLFAVPHGGQQLWPGFQLDEEGQPRPVIAEVLEILGPELPPWQVALWFTGRSGWLDGERPVDLLASEPARVIEAARREGEPAS